MTLGNPYKFAILIDRIDDWNIDDAFCNGLLLLCVNGTIFPDEILTATLQHEIEPLKQNLLNLATDQRLYALPSYQAFVEIYNITFPEDIDVANDYRFDITPSLLSDSNCFIFAVGDGENVRILASKLDYDTENSKHKLQDINVCEAFLSVAELKEIISGLENFSYH